MSVIDAQSLEKCHGSAGEQLKSSTEEYQLLQLVSQFHQGPNSNTCSMGKEHKETEVYTCLQGYDLIDIMVGWLPWLECWNGRIKALQEG